VQGQCMLYVLVKWLTEFPTITSWTSPPTPSETTPPSTQWAHKRAITILRFPLSIQPTFSVPGRRLTSSRFLIIEATGRWGPL
jgi:hypothetical protein